MGVKLIKCPKCGHSDVYFFPTVDSKYAGTTITHRCECFNTMTFDVKKDENDNVK
jgi:hypothetical protein